LLEISAGVTSHAKFNNYVVVLPCNFNHAGLRATLSAVKKLIGMRPRRQCTAGEVGIAAAADADAEEDTSTDMERWEAYQELLEGLDSTATDEQQEEQLKQYIEVAEKQYDAAGGDFSTAASESVYQKILYSGQLLVTVATKWWDNPAPCNGVCTLEVHKSGRWGGQNHSLEVRIKQLECTPMQRSWLKSPSHPEWLLCTMFGMQCPGRKALESSHSPTSMFGLLVMLLMHTPRSSCLAATAQHPAQSASCMLAVLHRRQYLLLVFGACRCTWTT
jgi:hypothetical protein